MHVKTLAEVPHETMETAETLIGIMKIMPMSQISSSGNQWKMIRRKKMERKCKEYMKAQK